MGLAVQNVTGLSSMVAFSAALLYSLAFLKTRKFKRVVLRVVRYGQESGWSNPRDFMTNGQMTKSRV